MARLSTSLAAASLMLLSSAPSVLGALSVNLDDPSSIKAAAKLVATDLLSFYSGDQPGKVPGILPGPPPDGDYYWWQGGALWGTMVDYWHWTGDSSFNNKTTQSLLFQVGDDWDYLPRNWSASMGNDDQAFWGLSALLAAETKYTDPAKDQPQWLSLAQAVFNEQTHVDRRVTSGSCNGGLRWQVYPSNQGYNYINTIANACYFNIGARLARYTNNDTYMQLAEATWEFVTRVGYLDAENNVYDGAHLPDCTDLNKAQFSYNAGLLIQGAAFLYNHTGGNSTWQTRIEGLLDRSLTLFFPDGVGYEPSCEGGTCNTDMTSYKGYMHRWLASTTQLAPFTKSKIMAALKTSAAAAVKQCTGGDNGRMCGFHWSSGAFDGKTGAGQQMNVLGALTALLVGDSAAPVTNSTGGTSQGDPNAGSDKTTTIQYSPITTGDRAGAGILTALLIAGAMGSFVWMSLDTETT